LVQKEPVLEVVVVVAVYYIVVAVECFSVAFEKNMLQLVLER
jgi:hypothetical protein